MYGIVIVIHCIHDENFKLIILTIFPIFIGFDWLLSHKYQNKNITK